MQNRAIFAGVDVCATEHLIAQLKDSHFCCQGSQGLDHLRVHALAREVAEDAGRLECVLLWTGRIRFDQFANGSTPDRGAQGLDFAPCRTCTRIDSGDFVHECSLPLTSSKYDLGQADV